ncbi:MAG TPA: LysR family transcriptional regulator [Stellaceae bacterium]|nr:LysR family transcriptional regulator [Stellaceae bacterium]
MSADWDDLRVFLTLARDGKLTAAARRLEVSHPTVARRVKALEDAIGARLFDRLPDRFVLTSAGEELLADAQAMERAAESIHRRSAGLGDTFHGTVRLSAGEAMAGFLAERLPRIRHNMNCVEIELVATHTLANLSRREADLLIREQVPDLASIVTRKLGRAAHAVYAGLDLAVADRSRAALRRMPWAGFDEEHGYMPGQGWVLDLLEGERPAVRVNNWLVLRDAARAGAGLAVLPCYLGDGDPRLRRVGPVLREVAADQWLLVHRDIRALPRVRAVMDALVRVFQEDRAAIEGRPPAAPLRAAE